MLHSIALVFWLVLPAVAMAVSLTAIGATRRRLDASTTAPGSVEAHLPPAAQDKPVERASAA